MNLFAVLIPPQTPALWLDSHTQTLLCGPDIPQGPARSVFPNPSHRAQSDSDGQPRPLPSDLEAHEKASIQNKEPRMTPSEQFPAWPRDLHPWEQMGGRVDKRPEDTVQVSS